MKNKPKEKAKNYLAGGEYVIMKMEREEKSTGGIVLPTTSQKSKWGTLVSIGSAVPKQFISNENGSARGLKVGDRVRTIKGEQDGLWLDDEKTLLCIAHFYCVVIEE